MTAKWCQCFHWRIRRPQADSVCLRETAQVRRKLRQAAQFHEISVGLDRGWGIAHFGFAGFFSLRQKSGRIFWRGTL
jgi:hypothetical protein